MIIFRLPNHCIPRALALTLAGGCAAVLAACSSSSGADAADPPPSSVVSIASSSGGSAAALGGASDPAGASDPVTASRADGGTSTTAPTHGSSPTNDPRTSGAPTSSTAARRGYCAESQLRATIDPRHIPGNGTDDTKGRQVKGVLIDFENTSRSSCVLYGYPGVATVNSAGKQVQQAKRTLRGSLGGLPDSQNGPSRVHLAPGDVAAAMLEGVDMQEQGAAQAGCAATTPRVLVTPPNTQIAVPFTVKLGVCFSVVIHPVRPVSAPN